MNDNNTSNNAVNESTSSSADNHNTASELSEFYERQSRRYGGGVSNGGTD